MEVSVVIITKNEAENISCCIKGAQRVSKDIIVVDSGSTDDTIKLARENGARVLAIDWTSFGDARNAGAAIANNDWILALDADERITEELVISINNLEQNNAAAIYGFRRQAYLIDKKIRFGDWGRDKVFRIYHRKATAWNLFPVHEALITHGVRKKLIKGNLEHLVSKSIDKNKEKLMRYAKLCANKYCLLGRKASVVNIIFSPAFCFFNGYFFRLGFLDGKEGFNIAKVNAYYTWLKYYYLYRLTK